jgi:polysaccharide export outer membrane protein
LKTFFDTKKLILIYFILFSHKLKKKMKKLLNKIFLIFGFLFFISCISKKDIVYLQFDAVDKENVNNDYQLRFKPDDLLQITVSADDLISVQPFNLPVVAYSALTNTIIGQPQLQSYLIDKDGYIDFPVLGKLKLGGLTRIESIDLLKNKLAPDHLKNPIVNINIVNFKITVQGDVELPGSFQIPNERISIFDAIGLSGGLRISGRRDNVLVIREENGNKNQYRINITSNSMLTSPVYYLQQNDVVYVEPNKAKMQDAAYTRSTGLFISLSSVLISLLTIITR